MVSFITKCLLACFVSGNLPCDINAALNYVTCGVYSEILMQQRCACEPSPILCPRRGWNLSKQGFIQAGSVNVHVLSGVFVPSVKRSRYVGRRTMLTHLLCALPAGLLPQSVDSASPTTSPRSANNRDDCEDKKLCETERRCQEGFTWIKLKWLPFF